jgi:hypothetical protein
MCNDLRTTEQIVVRFNTGESHDKPSCNFSFTWNWANWTSTLAEDIIHLCITLQHNLVNIYQSKKYWEKNSYWGVKHIYLQYIILQVVYFSRKSNNCNTICTLRSFHDIERPTVGPFPHLWDERKFGSRLDYINFIVILSLDLVLC